MCFESAEYPKNLSEFLFDLQLAVIHASKIPHLF